jgi:hypothetical protein
MYLASGLRDSIIRGAFSTVLYWERPYQHDSTASRPLSEVFGVRAGSLWVSTTVGDPHIGIPGVVLLLPSFSFWRLFGAAEGMTRTLFRYDRKWQMQKIQVHLLVLRVSSHVIGTFTVDQSYLRFIHLARCQPDKYVQHKLHRH